MHTIVETPIVTKLWPDYWSEDDRRRITMPLSEDELINRDSQRDIGKELLEAVGQMKSGEVGFVHKVTISKVASARIKAGLSQSQFAELLGVSVRTLLDWERGKRRPTGAAKNLIAIAASHPEILHELLEEQPAM
jgi:putative transcriptional regulator